MSRQSERTPAASVVIPVHNAAAVISEQLLALCAQRDVDQLEVIAVLNRCSDTSAEVIRSFVDRLDLKIVTADRLASAAYARNVGAGMATSSVILFCDADDRVSATWARDLVDGLLTADLVGGRILVDRDGLPEWAYRYFYADKEAGLLLREGRIPYPISACMGIRASALLAVNGFDESFIGASGEETDLAIRLLRAGFRVGFVDGAVLHYRPRTGFRELSRQQRSRAFSNSRLSLREGVQIRRPTAIGHAYQTARRLGRRVILERTFHPLALASDVVVVSARYAAAKWASTAIEPLYDSDPGVLDFVIDLGTPVIGGLAFRTKRAHVHVDPISNETQRTVLAVLSHLLAPGDVVVDLDARIGLTAVAAARMVEPTGRVVALAADAENRQLLRSNLLRHGCERVEVPDPVRSNSSASTAAVGRSHSHSHDGDEPARALDSIFDSVLGGEVEAIVVAAIGPSRWVHDARRIASELRASGLYPWMVEPLGDGTATRVRVLGPDRADDLSVIPAVHDGWVIAVPDRRRDDMVKAVEQFLSHTDSHPRPGGDTVSTT